MPDNRSIGRVGADVRACRSTIARDGISMVRGDCMISLSSTRPFVACGAMILAAGIVSGPVRAADLPLVTKAPPPPPASLFWVELDYLAWNVKGDHLPPLVTTGVLGAPGTAVLFGDSRVNDGWRSGGRLQAGYWFDQTRARGVEASFFALEDASTNFGAASNTAGLPILARP